MLLLRHLMKRMRCAVSGVLRTVEASVFSSGEYFNREQTNLHSNAPDTNEFIEEFRAGRQTFLLQTFVRQSVRRYFLVKLQILFGYDIPAEIFQ